MSHMFCHPHIYPNIKKTQIKGKKKTVSNANNKSLHKVDVHDDPEFAIAPKKLTWFSFRHKIPMW